MDNREGIQPESLNPKPGHIPPKTDASANGVPKDAVREGEPPVESFDPYGPEGEPGFFSPTNILMLGMIAALAIFLVSKFNLEELWNIAKAALGLSFVIFIHELGHFLAAKWCGVNVTTFSIGFGPPIPGCSFTSGETTYKLAILPLGGYVQMVGQVDGDESSDDGDDPRSYRKKTVSQRMLIISAGVIMNAILAIFCFIAVYQGPGRKHPSGVVSIVDSGGPVFKKGVPTGALITLIGDEENPNFTDLKYTVIFSRAGKKIPLAYRLKNEGPFAIEIESRKDKNDKMRAIGVAHPWKLEFSSKREAPDGPFIPGTPAAMTKEKFEVGDVIVAMTDPDDPELGVTKLPDDWRFPDQGQADYFEFTRRLQLLADKHIVLRIRRGEKEKVEEIDIKVAPMFGVDLGMRMQMGPIRVVRENSPADGVVRVPDAEKKLEGDQIESVTVTEADGKSTEYKDKNLDPERLPRQLRQWSERLDKAGVPDDKRTVTLQVRRHVDRPGKQFETVPETLLWDKKRRFDRVVPLSLNSPMPIPELGIAYQVKAIVLGVTGKDVPLEVGDVIKNIRIDVEGVKEVSQGLWGSKDIEEGQWAYFSNSLTQVARKITKLSIKVERRAEKGEKKIVEVEIPISVDPTRPLEDRGWLLAGDSRIVKADDPLHAIQLGFTDTYRRMMEVFFTLRGIFMGDISAEVIGGPITIAYGTYRFAGMDFAEFVFFLGLISINLAVVNFLPIPVLDGGHMVFLIYEKIRGKPASESVRIWATYTGLFMILCLMLFVLYQDVTRFFL